VPVTISNKGVVLSLHPFIMQSCHSLSMVPVTIYTILRWIASWMVWSVMAGLPWISAMVRERRMILIWVRLLQFFLMDSKNTPNLRS
jgi:hypothetical protein